jgi:hypothetical protein
LFISGLHHFCGFFLFCIRKVGWFCFLYRG